MNKEFKLKASTLIHLLVIAFVFFIINLKNFFFYWDGVDIAYYLDNPTHRYMIHQHHLAFAPFCYLLFSIVKYLGGTISSIIFLIKLNIIIGLVVISICYYIFRNIFYKFIYSGIWGILIMLSSYGFCTYWRNSDQYIIPILIISILSFRLIKKLINNTVKVTFFDWFLIFFAGIFHQMSLLFLPAIIYMEFNTPGKGALFRIAKRITLILFVTLTLNILVFWFTNENPSLDSFLFWFSGYAKHPFWIFSSDQGIYNSLIQGFIESFYSHKALFLAPIDRSTILRLPDYQDAIFDRANGTLINNCIGVLILVFLISGFYISLSIKRYRKLSIFCFIWILPYLVFLQIFVPFQIFYRLFYLLPFVILIMVTIENLNQKLYSKIFALVFLISLLAYNMYFGFLPESKPYNNPYLILSKVIRENSGGNDLFIFPNKDYFYGKYLRYFGHRDVAWIRRFKKENYPDITNDMIDEKNAESIEFLKRKYTRIYMPTYVQISQDPQMIIPLSGYEPKMLILFPDQINFIRKKHFFDRTFYSIGIESND